VEEIPVYSPYLTALADLFYPDRRNRSSLVYDLMEPLRPYVDRKLYR